MLVRSSSPEVWVVGIDDTDMPGLGGTGQLARRLVAEVEALGVGRSTGITRHQFFEGPGVPKTSRNSAAAIALDGVASPAELFETVCGIVSREAVDGSDPGVAMAGAPVADTLVAFARRAQHGLVAQAEARSLGATHATALVGLGGTEDGVIGALGAVALRVDGNDGRFVGLPGIREVTGVVTVADLLEQTGVEDVVNGEMESLSMASRLDVGDWLRPRLIDGRPVVVAQSGKENWVNADRRHT